MKSRHWFTLVTLVIALAMVLGACQPQTVVETVEVEKVVEKEVEVEKVVEKEVVVEVEVEAPEKLEDLEVAKEFLKGKKFCALLSGPVNDGGWNTNAYLGLVNLRDNFDMDILYRESTKPEEAADVLREYADAGCDVLYAHGFQFADQVNQVSEEYPDKQFIQSSRGTGKEPNVTGISYVSGEGGYYAGMIACLLSSTGKTVFVAGMAFPQLSWEVEQMKVAFDDMVKNGIIDEPCTASQVEVGNWYDSAKAKELTVAGIEDGVDVFVMMADAADAGVIEAIREAREAGKEVYAVSTVGDRNYLGKDFIVGGYKQMQPIAIELATVRYALNGKPVGTPYPTGMLDGTIITVPNYGLLEAEGEKYTLEVLNCYMEKGLDCELMGDVQFRTDL